MNYATLDESLLLTAFFEAEFALRACEHFDVISNSHKTKQGIKLFAHWIADRRTR